MRTTVRLDDELLEQLKARARRDNVSITRLLNRVVRLGLQAAEARPAPRRPFREKPVSMGRPRVPLDKALALASSLEEEEIVRELSVGR